MFINDFEICFNILQLINRLEKMPPMQIRLLALSFGASIWRAFSLFNLWYLCNQLAQAPMTLAISLRSIFLKIHQILLSLLLFRINFLDLQELSINSIKVWHLLIFLVIIGLARYVKGHIGFLRLQALVAWLISVIYSLRRSLRWLDCLVQDLVFRWKHLLRIALLLVHV